jgi:hypothetical protein
VYKIDLDTGKNDVTLIERWLAKHQFWYETLPNRMFDECYALSRPNETLPRELKSYLAQSSARYQLQERFDSSDSTRFTAYKFLICFVINLMMILSFL